MKATKILTTLVLSIIFFWAKFSDAASMGTAFMEEFKPRDTVKLRTVGIGMTANEKDDSLLILIPGGKSMDGEPPFGVELPAFYAGITPVTNLQYKQFVDATSHHPPDQADSWGKAIWYGQAYPSEKPLNR